MNPQTSARVPGHTLKHEGHHSAYEDGTYRGWGFGAPCAQCSCGAVSPPRQSITANKRWHREHKHKCRTSQGDPA